MSDQASSSSKRPASPADHEYKKESPVCKYGEKCYRKNPQHFKEFSHPHLGKLNYVSAESYNFSEAAYLVIIFIVFIDFVGKIEMKYCMAYLHCSICSSYFSSTLPL